MTTLRAIILAAGRGERMRPLTDSTPKPLLPDGGKPMIVWHLEALARAGVREVVINTAWLEEQFPAALGDGSRWGLRITWSFEGRDHGGALETAGGIATVMEHLAPQGDEPFWVVSGDIHCPGFQFEGPAPDKLAHLWLVPNPDFHPQGDFTLDANGAVRPLGQPGAALTYANIALMRPGLLAGTRAGVRAPLGPLLQKAAAAGQLTGELWADVWENVGTPQQWRALQGGDEV